MLKSIKKYFDSLFKSKKQDEKAIQPVPFDDEVIDKLKHSYINGLTISIQIKYLIAAYGTKRCEYMAYALDDVDIVLGEIKNVKTGNSTLQGWIEKDGFVYDTITFMKYDTDTYYKTRNPKNVVKYSKEEFLNMNDNREINDEVRSTTIDDFKPNGRKRKELSTMIDVAKNFAKNNDEFKKELEEFLVSIDYYEEELESLEEELDSYNVERLTPIEISKLKECIKRYNEAVNASRKNKLERALEDAPITSCENCPLNKGYMKH